jgi:predicted ATPase/class 3 adenylate cyclase/GAF domain-containing protein/tRNA A-37 threonylcarbamoyl transferase component Bud32
MTNQHSGIDDVIPGYILLEKIRESQPHTLYRAIRAKDDVEVVIKTLADKYPRKENLASIRREFRITNQLQLDGIVGVFELVPHSQGNLAMVMEQFGISLIQYLDAFENHILPPDLFFPIAIRLVEILGQVHDRKIVHKNVIPSNILIHPESRELRLIDFSSSSELSREHLDNMTMSKRIEGSLPYISPEQTGRMNRDIDYRTDYYSLGVSFYQLLTGQLPFTANDPLEWVHCHISRQPPSPASINRQIPKGLSAIILKLMAKNAEERYQSSEGLIADLVTCRQRWKEGKDDESFTLGSADRSHKFQIPQKLYGREREIEKLESYFENAAHGSVEFCLVSGYSGIGKTVLVHELGRSIVKRRGYLIHGKFEQFRQNTSYIALANAYRDLIRQLLGESKKRLDRWSKKISDALGQNAQLIVDLIPELALIIGKQPPVQDLSPAETQIRFQLLFLDFVKVFASEDHPFVIFLDDLQWSDVPTLNLIQRLVTSHELSYLFIIGTYRENEIDIAHPLTLILREIEQKRFVENLSLQPLSPEATNQLTSDTLLCDRKYAQDLSSILYDKAGGNPFFTIELLKNLKDRDVIRFNASLNTWDWDIQRVRQVEYSNNVVDILVARQNQLSPAAQHALQLASCIGATFDLRTLSIISERTMEQTGADLEEALKASMVIPLNESYKFVSQDTPESSLPSEVTAQEINPRYKFQHDRVQQAAYSLIDPAQRKEFHLSIGRLMLSHAQGAELDEKLVDIVSHLNEGRAFVHDPQERRALARLNLAAGTKAKQSSAYDSALQYLKIANEMVSTEVWQEDYALAWNLGNELQHCFYLTGDRDNADTWTEIMLEKSRTSIEKGLILAARTRQYATTGRMQESLQAAYQGFAILGFDFQQEPTAADVAEEVKRVSENLRGRAIAELIAMPELTDERAKIASQLIMETFAAAFLSASGEMFPYLVLKSVNIALEYGNSPESAFAYAAYAMILCGMYDDTPRGYEYGQLSVSMIEKFEDVSLKSRIIYLYTMFVHHWSNHWTSMTPWFRKGIEAGYQSGDLLYLAYSAQDCIIWDPQLDLESASQEHRRMLAIVKECEYQDSFDSGSLFLQMQLNFQGLTKSKFSMTDDAFDETACVEGMRSRRFMTGISNYHIYKAEIHLMYNDAEGALEHVLEQDKRMSSVMSLPQAVRFHIVSFLVRAMLIHASPGQAHDEHLLKMTESLERITGWAKNCKENFEHLRLLMEAGFAAIDGRAQDALALYEKSIAAARLNGFQRDEAMANEMAARLLMRLGLSKAAEGYLQDAHYLYYRWGAHRKVEAMEAEYKIFRSAGASRKNQSFRSSNVETGAMLQDSINADALDINSVLRASQTISGELVLEKLLKATIQILMENAGAQKGFLVEHRDGQIYIQSQGQTDGEEQLQTLSLKDAQGQPVLPVTLINTAIRTKEPIVINNASEMNPFSSDPYIKRAKPLSVMCVPLPLHGLWPSAVYLENNLTHSAFTDERVHIIKLLASQASISMENARIYDEQEKLLKAQQRFVPIQFLKHLGHTDIAKVELGESVSMEMSVLFSDIRNFTPLVERLSPKAVIELLNQFYSQLGIPISACGGFIDSYSGDGIMALFAVPPQKAVEAGIMMSKTLEQFNTSYHSNSPSGIKIGIGVNTGPLVLGTMGANDRMQCSVLGDTVNLASRIEQLTRVYDAQFLIAENTMKHLDNPHAFSTRMVDCVAVKGKAIAVHLHEILDAETDERRAAKEATKTLLCTALEAYFARDFIRARHILEEAIAMDPIDPVLSTFASRAEKYTIDPPPADWQGYEKLYQK